MRFDPGFEHRKEQHRHDVLSTVREKAQEFCRSVEVALSSADMAADKLVCNPLCRDLVLVAALGGLEGVECLKLACGLVPEQFMAERSHYVDRIVNSVLHADKQLSAKNLEMLGLSSDSIKLCEAPSTIPVVHFQSEASIGS